MKKAIVIALGGIFGLTLSTASPAEPLVRNFGQEATSRFVSGVITSVEGRNVTIAPFSGGSPSSGRIEPGRTRIVVNGRAGNASDIKVTYAARAELGLDDVWVSINVTPKR